MQSNPDVTRAAAPLELPVLLHEHAIADADALFGVACGGHRLYLAFRHLVTRVDPDSGRVLEQLETFPEPGGLAYDGEALWQRCGPKLQRIDARTGFVLRSFDLELGDTSGIAHKNRELWVARAGAPVIVRLDTFSGAVMQTITLDAPASGLAWAEGDLWCGGGGELRRVDPQTGRVLARAPLPPRIDVRDMTVDERQRLWFVDGRTSLLRAFSLPAARYRQAPAV